MTKIAMLVVLAAGQCLSISSFAQASAATGTTALCQDGTFYIGKSNQGACAGHKGVKTWYGVSKAVAASGASTAVPSAASGMSGTMDATKRAVPAGASAQVWANIDTKVYHCARDPYYGKTKHGEYLPEAAAKAQGFHASHGKACS
ncbi:DUF3761 domain-containing protein [Burkholderia ubonensis]|uniref:DUF3761 domain-containing protein n=1 Tax=Burkholderia ubonensis TaxID=101571 RepID=UPI000758CA9B|nr:DUF3761 domain-containing protein [Burkholderia ubonensis]KVW81356.1 hypothetical protein WK99_22200 [Burkholderia ubonensis]